MSQRFTVVCVGICYLLIQSFGNFILSKCTSTICVLWNNKIAGCLVIYCRNTVSASSWEASKWLVSLSGLEDSIWVASLKLQPAKIVLSTGVCSMSGKGDVLRSSTERLLKIPKTNPKTLGECSFGYIAPTVRNSLPADLRASPSLPTFKVNLKTHFFR